MANPIGVPCNQDEWTLVASNILIGYLSKTIEDSNFKYFWTSRDAGQAAPTVLGDGGLALPLFETERREKMQSSVNQDFYVWVTNILTTNTQSAIVRVDI